VNTFDAFVTELCDEIAAAVRATVPDAIAATQTLEWRLVDAAEAGRLLGGMSARWVYAASQVGGPGYLRLPFVMVGVGRKMYDPEALRRWAQERQIPAEMPAESSRTLKSPGNHPLSRRKRIPTPRGDAAGLR